MIFDKWENIGRYASAVRFADKITDFCCENDLNTMPFGRYEIEGTDLYVNVQTAVTAPFCERGWESHKLYADLQLVISGEESFGISCAALPEPDESKVENDYYFYAKLSSKSSVLTCEPGEFVYFAPGEPHSPCCTADEPKKIKKAVFKIKLA